MPIKILAKNYSTREELEADITRRFGRTTEIKEHTIEGNREELERLQLNDKRRVWGLACVIFDTPTENKAIAVKEKPERGEIFKSGINLEEKLSNNIGENAK